MTINNQENDDNIEIGLTKGVRILRRVVIIMGFVLVFGFIALIVAAYFKFNKPNPSVNYIATQQVQPPRADTKIPAASEMIPSLETPADKCTFKQNTDLAIDGDVISYSLNNNILTVVTAKKPKFTIPREQEGTFLTLTAQKPAQSPQQIIIFDLCRGDILSRVHLVEEK